MPDDSLSSRELAFMADGSEIAAGCRIHLTAREELTLRPALHLLEIRNLSDSDAARLQAAQTLQVFSAGSLLVQGTPLDLHTRAEHDGRITSVTFSPGLALWQSAVSLSLSAGMRVSETVRALLAASAPTFSSVSRVSAFQSSVSPAFVPLAAFAAQDRVISRPQAFFGRTCDAISALAESVSADACLTPAGLCISGRVSSEFPLLIPENALLSAPVQKGSRLLLNTDMIGWPLGSWAQIHFRGQVLRGRLVSRLIDADNRRGPWSAQLEMEMS